MLDNTITLSVDAANDSNPADQVFTRAREVGDNKVVYERADHTLVTRRELSFARRFNTRNGNFRGTGKSDVKLTFDKTVAGVDGSDLVAPLIAGISVSAPVGVTEADVIEIAQILHSFLDVDTLVKAVMLSLHI